MSKIIDLDPRRRLQKSELQAFKERIAKMDDTQLESLVVITKMKDCRPDFEAWGFNWELVSVVQVILLSLGQQVLTEELLDEEDRSDS